MIQELNVNNWNEPLSMISLMGNLSIGAVLSIFISYHFNRFSSVYSNKQALSSTIIFIVLVTILVISVVKSSLALSLGLVGALSIVRFRTPIKEPEELSYLFLSIATGLGLGANQRYTTIVSVFVILFVMTCVKKLKKQEKYSSGIYANIISHKKDLKLPDITDIFMKNCDLVDIKRLDISGEITEISYKISIKEFSKMSKIIDELKQKDEEIKVSFIDNSKDPTL